MTCLGHLICVFLSHKNLSIFDTKTYKSYKCVYVYIHVCDTGFEYTFSKHQYQKPESWTPCYFRQVRRMESCVQWLVQLDEISWNVVKLLFQGIDK